jgi:hypothetical protein
MPALLSALPTNPLFTFTLLLLVILTLPPLFERLRLVYCQISAKFI